MLQFDLLREERVKHGVFTREGGVSPAPYESLNLGFEMGDEEQNVLANLDRVAKALGLNTLYSAKQCHGKEILEVKPGVEKSPADILATNHLDCPLLIKHADCQGAIIYDPVQHAVSAVHCGWRGTVQNVYGEAISFMRGKYGSKPENLLVCITPSLGPDSSQFINYRTELPEHFWQFQFKPLYFNFWEISRSQVQACGVLPHHIEIMEVDTMTNRDFFSYRRDKITGRNGTVVCLVGP